MLNNLQTLNILDGNINLKKAKEQCKVTLARKIRLQFIQVRLQPYNSCK